MGILNMDLKEYNYLVNNTREAFTLIGQPAVLFQVHVEARDLYYDPEIEYKQGIQISLIFEQNPQPLLKKFNWLTEGEDTPYVANITSLADDGSPLEIQENMKIFIPSRYGLKTERLFLVSRVHANNIDPLVYLCKLVPYRPHSDIDPLTPGYQHDLKDGKSEDRGMKYIKEGMI